MLPFYEADGLGAVVLLVVVIKLAILTALALFFTVFLLVQVSPYLAAAAVWLGLCAVAWRWFNPAIDPLVRQRASRVWSSLIARF